MLELLDVLDGLAESVGLAPFLGVVLGLKAVSEHVKAVVHLENGRDKMGKLGRKHGKGG